MIRAFLEWWRGELAGCLPGAVRRIWNGQPTPTTIRFDAQAEEITQTRRSITLPHTEPSQLAALDAVGASGRSQKPADVVWPAKICLERRIALPAGATSRAHEIARLDLVRDTPIDPASILWRHRVERDGDGDQHIRQFVMKRKDLANLQSWLTGNGFALRRLELDAGAGNPLTFLDATAELARPWRFWRGLNAMLVAGAIALGGWLIWEPHAKRQQQLATLDQEIGALQTEAIALREELDAIAADQTEQARFVTELTTRQRMSDALRVLTTTLPEHSWLETLDADQNYLRLAGQSRDSAADLIAHLSGPFRLPELIGPVTRDARAETERFTIQIPLGAPQ